MTKSLNYKLTDSQLVILSAAAARDNGTVLPLPPSLTLNKGAARLVLESLVRKSLAAEIAASRDDAVWRVDDNDERLTLIITDQGLTALGLDGAASRGGCATSAEAPEGAPGAHGAVKPSNDCLTQSQMAGSPGTGENAPAFHTSDTAASAQNTKRPSTSSSSASAGFRSGSKQALVVDMIRRNNGATIDELVTATGWQPHTVRAALSSSRKRGVAVTSDRTGGVTRYRAEAGSS